MSAPAIRDDATGAELVDAIRAAATDLGRTAREIVLRITPHAQTWLSQLARAKRPKPETVAKVRRVIEEAAARDEAAEIRRSRAETASARQAREGWRKRHAAEAPRQAAQAAALLAAYTEAADAGAPCPTDLELAARLGISATLISSRRTYLVRERAITTETQRQRRAVTIVATGRSTTLSMPAASFRGGNAGAAMLEALPPRVDRDPCFKCGVRGDIGCAHQPAGGAW